MASAILDASALLAHIGGEPGADGLDALAGEALISAVNLAEVLAKLSERGLSQRDADGIVYRYRLEVIPFDEELARQTGALRPATRSLGLSLGDRACLALAQRERLPVLTADRSWAKLDLGVAIRVVR
ncbi:MAG TPA: type II toxin-antitoxin system VapC family toxin [Hyphomicrobiaceae bacterium]|nr:type II toxin-antitoxin system VapC family toxin [Hyphomicrobiaceae bacterium]